MADPQASSALMQSMMQYAQPQNLPQIRHSEYLSNALQSLQETGAQQSKTPGALISNLLAEALLRRGDRKSFKDLYGTLAGNRDTVMNAGASDPVMSNLFGGAAPSMAAGGAPQAPPQSPAPLNVAPPGPPAGVGAPPPQAAPPMAQAAPAPAQPQQGPPMMQVPPQLMEQYKYYVGQYQQTHMPQFAQQAAQIRDQIEKLATTQVPLKLGDAYQADGSVKSLGDQVYYAPGGKPGTQIGTNRSTGEKKLFDSGIVNGDKVFQNGQWVLPPTNVGGRIAPLGAATPATMDTMSNRIFGQNSPYMRYTQIHQKIPIAIDAIAHPDATHDQALADILNEAINGSPTLAVSDGMYDKTIAAQGGLSHFFTNIHNSLSSGSGLLTPQIRQAILDVARRSEDERYSTAKEFMRVEGSLAGSQGLDPKMLPTLEPSHMEEERAKTKASPAPAAAPDAGVPHNGAPASAPAGTQVNPVHITSQADVQKLPKGSFWVGPSGRLKGPT